MHNERTCQILASGVFACLCNRQTAQLPGWRYAKLKHAGMKDWHCAPWVFPSIYSFSSHIQQPVLSKWNVRARHLLKGKQKLGTKHVTGSHLGISLLKGPLVKGDVSVIKSRADAAVTLNYGPGRAIARCECMHSTCESSQLQSPT